MKRFQFPLFAMIALAATSVACNSGSQNEEAATGEALETDSVEATGATYTISSEESMVEWVGYKATGQHNGTIAISEGSLMVEGEELTGGQFVLDMTSVEVKDLEEGGGKIALEGHLMGPDFFYAYEAMEEGGETNYRAVDTSAPKFEEGTFDIVAVDALEEGDSTGTHVIKGNLSLRGVTKSIEFPATVEMSDDAIMANASFSLDRTKWGVASHSEDVVARLKDAAIEDMFDVTFKIKATKAEM